MGTLAEKYPNARRLEIALASPGDEEELYNVLAPYLTWDLGEVDMSGTDILIYRKTPEAEMGIAEVMLLGGSEAVAWLRLKKSHGAA